MIIREKIDIEKLINNSNNYYPDRIKFCIDRKRKVVSVDEEYHIDMENELFSDGSKDEVIFGGDILFYPEVSVLWEAHPNINRNMQLGIGKGRELTDTKLIDELFDILKEWIK